MRTSDSQGPAKSSVLYGVCGIGLGHATRAVEIAKGISENRGICMASGGAAREFLRREANGNAVVADEIDVADVYPGSKTSYDFFRTAYKNLPKLHKVFYRNWRVFDKCAPGADAVVSDHEVSSLLWGKAKAKKTVSISHVHGMFFSHLFGGFPNPLNIMYSIPLDLPASSLAGMADAVVNTHFFIPEKRKILNTHFFGPVVQGSIMRRNPEHGEDIVVYLPNPLFEPFLGMCAKNPPEQKVSFFCSPQQKALAKPIVKDSRNIVLNDITSESFRDALVSAKCFVSHGGISSLTEALFLKKPCFALTDKYFYERYFNGKAMEMLGYGMCRESADAGEFGRFLENHDEYAKALKKKPVVPANKEIVKFINSIIN